MADQREVAGRILKVLPKVIAEGKEKGGLMTVSEVKAAVISRFPLPMKNNNKAIENLKSTAIFNMAQDKIMKIQVKEGRMLTMNEQMNIHRKYKTLINEILKKSGKVMKMSELKSAVKARLTPSPKYNSSNK